MEINGCSTKKISAEFFKQVVVIRMLVPIPTCVGVVVSQTISFIFTSMASKGFHLYAVRLLDSKRSLLGSRFTLSFA